MAVDQSKPNTIKEITYRLTQKEINLIELLRQRRINYGTIQCLLIYQDGEVVRVEMEPARESFKM